MIKEKPWLINGHLEGRICKPIPYLEANFLEGTALLLSLYTHFALGAQVSELFGKPFPFETVSWLLPCMAFNCYRDRMKKYFK